MISRPLIRSRLIAPPECRRIRKRGLRTFTTRVRRASGALS